MKKIFIIFFILFIVSNLFSYNLDTTDDIKNTIAEIKQTVQGIYVNLEYHYNDKRLYLYVIEIDNDLSYKEYLLKLGNLFGYACFDLLSEDIYLSVNIKDCKQKDLELYILGGKEILLLKYYTKNTYFLYDSIEETEYLLYNHDQYIKLDSSLKKYIWELSQK